MKLKVSKSIRLIDYKISILVQNLILRLMKFLKSMILLSFIEKSLLFFLLNQSLIIKKISIIIFKTLINKNKHKK